MSFHPFETLHIPQPDSSRASHPSKFADENNYRQSEDFLTINIWSKATSRKDKPAFVFFYGGSKPLPTPSDTTLLITGNAKDGLLTPLILLIATANS
jgi:carboxylesterase type B